uniref:Uncharacterized protein n=1 Tax=Tetradesmus obliquus TaxID=3088 RepID=A0A383W173_TETOB|eukprot:jgi/Sobl393_1/16623/SZX70842.1
MASAQPAWSWQATEALLARLSPPTAAALHSEYANCQRLTAWLNSDPLTAHFDQLTASQRSGVLQRWCALAQPLLQVITHQADQIAKYPAAFSAVGVLLNALGQCLERWVWDTAAEQQQALKRQIAKHTAGLAPVLAQVMATIAAQLGRVTPQQRAATVGAAATAAHFRHYFPTHSDVCMAAQLLGLWKGLALVRPGKLLRSSSSSSSSSRRAQRSSSSSLQETVLPACDLAVSLLKT